MSYTVNNSLISFCLKVGYSEWSSVEVWQKGNVFFSVKGNYAHGFMHIDQTCYKKSPYVLNLNILMSRINSTPNGQNNFCFRPVSSARLTSVTDQNVCGCSNHGIRGVIPVTDGLKILFQKKDLSI